MTRRGRFGLVVALILALVLPVAVRTPTGITLGIPRAEAAITGNLISRVYVDKARYNPGNTATITVECLKPCGDRVFEGWIHACSSVAAANPYTIRQVRLAVSGDARKTGILAAGARPARQEDLAIQRDLVRPKQQSRPAAPGLVDRARLTPPDCARNFVLHTGNFGSSHRGNPHVAVETAGTAGDHAVPRQRRFRRRRGAFRPGIWALRRRCQYFNGLGSGFSLVNTTGSPAEDEDRRRTAIAGPPGEGT